MKVLFISITFLLFSCTSQNQKYHLSGEGVIVDLDGTGDENTIEFQEKLKQDLQHFDIDIDPGMFTKKNIAFVNLQVSSNRPFFKNQIIEVDVLQTQPHTDLTGGTLLVSPLTDNEGNLRAVVQGTISKNKDGKFIISKVSIIK